jgi:hypothetical protein
VFAFVIDSDADKGKGLDLGGIVPTLTVESSPGNAHHWLRRAEFHRLIRRALWRRWFKVSVGL